jgi:hypothetical protein
MAYVRFARDEISSTEPLSLLGSFPLVDPFVGGE